MRRSRTLVSSLAVVALLVGTGCDDDSPAGSEAAEELAEQDLPAVLEVTSSAFSDGDPVPEEFTCDGADLAPPLAWSSVPAGTESLAIVVDDPDAPGGTFVHWIVMEIAGDVGETVEGQSPGVQLANSFGVEEYRGPCPPPGDDPHRYRFHIYALASDGVVCATDDDCPSPSIDDALDHISEHVRAEGALTGTYGR